MKYSLNGTYPSVPESCYLAPGSILIGNIELHDNSSVWFNTVLRGDNEKISIGEGSNIQDGTVIHSDPGFPVEIGKNVTVGHNAIIHGCTIEDGALIGMGATILNGAVIKKGALVAANSLVPEGKIIESGTLVAGVPTRKIRNQTAEQLLRCEESAAHYVENANTFKNHLLSTEKAER
ncbi:gamma carbonic anhydrase family protein [Alkalihalobacillus sp. AL-G]|uniref:gamma carbonic anhydrase family protein n=1 Tax=Alkalihalobacillus sp. AL-G TaxID=2926399 RepID=UPI00272A6B33|nr:gamma carbonic anhydrase family protein [Alkalihalobacillus sp. AL-G]WLD94397.1 gamma carbonic anhydrase family protein [Alkalihalobacillus sp. AL-G]